MEIVFSNHAKRELKNLDARMQQKILFTLDKFKNNQRVDIIKLKNKGEDFRIRAGNYRIELQKIKEGFLGTKVGKRENFYMIFL